MAEGLADRSSAGDGPGEPTQQESLEQALQRALGHARAAAAEGLLAARALLDAASIALFDEPIRTSADADRAGPPLRLALSSAARGLDELTTLAGPGRSEFPDSLLSTILDSLDDEIDRWEARSADDAEARAVLRAFLGVREILWEVGVRHPGAEVHRPAGKRAAQSAAHTATAAPPRPRPTAAAGSGRGA